MKSQKIGVIGAGNMAAALVKGMLTQEDRKPDDILCVSKHNLNAKALASETGVTCVGTLKELVENADIIMLAFKPKSLEGIASQINVLAEGKLIFSVLASVTTDELSKYFPKARGIIRVMPNILSEVGASITAYCLKEELKSADNKPLAEILNSWGTAFELPEEQMDAFTVVAGSGPAYIFEFINMFAQQIEKLGFQKDLAGPIALHLLLGASALIGQTSASVESLVESVAPQGGCTEAALSVLRNRGLNDIMEEAIMAALERLKK